MTACPHAWAWPGSVNLSRVKALRFWLLILLALVLPMRGALAQALPCAGHDGTARSPVMQGLVPATGGAQEPHTHHPSHHPSHRHAHSAAQDQDPTHWQGHGPAEQADVSSAMAHADAQPDAPVASSHAASHAAHHADGKCSACASCCIGTPVAGTATQALPLLPATGLLKSPSGSSPLASVVLGGLERPPRAL